jgi:putative tryptophan/tyrosine transport system substrate-binding protein
LWDWSWAALQSLARPGGNLTGVAQTTGPEFFRKRLQLLKELAPRISRAAFLGPRGVLEQDRGVATLAGVTIIPVQVDVTDQLDAAFDRIPHERADALMVAGSAITYGYHFRIVAFSTENKLPAIHAFREAVEAGGLVSYGTSIPGIFSPNGEADRSNSQRGATTRLTDGAGDQI